MKMTLIIDLRIMTDNGIVNDNGSDNGSDNNNENGNYTDNDNGIDNGSDNDNGNFNGSGNGNDIDNNNEVIMIVTMIMKTKHNFPVLSDMFYCPWISHNRLTSTF